GDVGAMHRWVHPHANGEAPHGDGRAHDGVRRRIEHRYAVAALVRDVGTMHRRVHPHGGGGVPHAYGNAHDGVRRRVDHHHLVATAIGHVRAARQRGRGGGGRRGRGGHCGRRSHRRAGLPEVLAPHAIVPDVHEAVAVEVGGVEAVRRAEGLPPEAI